MLSSLRRLRRNARWLLRFARRSDIDGAPAIALRYLELRLLERIAPRWRRPVTLLGYKVCFTDLPTLRWLYKEILIDRDYEESTDLSVSRIIDAGANIGLATLFFRKRYPDAEIVCFEPDPRAFACLRRNLTQNKVRGVTAHNVGLGTDRRKTTLFVHPTVENSCQSMSRSFATSLLSPEERPTELEVDVAPLEEFIVEDVDLMKIDVEGAELNVLRGAGPALARIRTIVMEYHQVPESALHEVLGVLADAGHQYEILTPVGSALGTVAKIKSCLRNDLS